MLRQGDKNSVPVIPLVSAIFLSGLNGKIYETWINSLSYEEFYFQLNKTHFVVLWGPTTENFSILGDIPSGIFDLG